MRSLRLYREASGISQTALAQKLGVSQKTVCTYELGRFKPTPERLKYMAAIVGTTPEQLETTERVLDALAPKRGSRLESR